MVRETRHDGAVMNLMIAALPAAALVASTTDLDLLPTGLTDPDTARISSVATARTDPPRLYALIWHSGNAGTPSVTTGT